MRYTVKDWSQFQHYRDRRPVWIKLYRSILDDTDFIRLPVQARALAPLLWLLAAETDDGSVPGDESELAFRLRLPEKEISVGVAALVAGGYLLASDMLADCKQPAILEKRREETERETEKKRAAARPDDVSEEVWRDWLQHRKALKATVTDTVLNRLRSESETAKMPLESVLALCCANGWRGFQAHWVGDRRSNGRTGAQTEEHPRGMPVPYTDPITGKRCGCPVCKTKGTD